MPILEEASGVARWSVRIVGAAAFAMLAVNELAIEREERYLAKFGADHQAYRARVRRWL